ncbi:peptidoglycan editing factor PgeF [Polynucleobacter necessarius]|uniref:peptidoglycan editing factor PgeF n=1 Tax=Polynucleobacter necessarius TaxID=576610 RepID=UPI000E09B0E3|nr:peptidoglycan editing factor PgeF [Polynucleobacter necessarius]
MNLLSDALIKPEWPVPPHIRSLLTTRNGGVSQTPYLSLNLGDHVGDEPSQVLANRALLRTYLPAEPHWLKQIHSAKVSTPDEPLQEADAIVSNRCDDVLAIMTADCLPVLFTNTSGTLVGAAHAGWRGLCSGVLENTVLKLQVLEPNLMPSDIMVWLGPAIGPDAFEVGQDVLDAFMDSSFSFPENAFVPIAGKSGKYLANIYLLACCCLEAVGVSNVYGGNFCTVTQSDQFFSYRRDGITGRFASLIWIAKS